jgi:hypothetical protein
MTMVKDGLYQFGGVPVNNTLLTNKVFHNYTNGRAWFVDPTYGGNGNGKSPAAAFSTMEAAFDHLASGDIIYFVGKVTEQLVTPVNVFDVTVVGCGNRPRHADATPVGGNTGTATWAAPASPVAAQALCRVIQQGWRFVNILWAGSAGCASLEFVRNAASGDDERDASHASVYGCRFAGVNSTDSAIKFGSTSYTEIVNNVLLEGNDFQGCATAIKEHSAGLQFRCQFTNNVFISNTNDVVLGGYFLHVIGNVMSLAPTSCLKLDGGTGSCQVHGNYLPGTYADGTLYNAGANDNWNGNYASTGVTAAVPA